MHYAVNYFKGKYVHWDINNEMLRESFYADRLGESIRTWMFQEANRIDPNCMLFVNETGVIAHGWFTEECKTLVTHLLSSGAPVHALGVQSHMDRDFDRLGVISRFNSIAELGLPIWVTEFSIDHADDNTRADDLEDFYRIAFSQPVVEGIVMVGFTESNCSALDLGWWIVNADWTLNEAGRRYESLMREWTTELNATTDENGQVSFRGFHGTYKITLMQNGEPCAVGTIELLPGQGVAEFALDDFAPFVEITSHENYDLVDGITTLTATATDDYGIQYVEFYIDDMLKFTDLTAPFDYNWDTSIFNNGLHTIIVRAIDLSGKETSEKVILTVTGLKLGLVIYDDTFRRGWFKAGWDTTVNLNNTSPVHTGNYSIHCDYTNLWAALAFKTDSPIEPNDYSSINFYIRGLAGDESLAVLVHCVDGEAYGKVLSMANIEGGRVSDSEWRLVTVVINELGVPNAGIDQLQIKNPTDLVTIYVDDVQFTYPVVSDEPPTITFDRPINGATVAGFERVLVSPVDDNGIERVEFYVDGELRFTDDEGPSYRFDWDTTNDPNGEHTLFALAYDTIGQNAVNKVQVDVNHAAVGLLPAFDGFETGDFNMLDWMSFGDADWIISTQAYSGIYCAQAGSIGNIKTSTLSVTFYCIEGDITFFCKVSSERNFDYLKFYIDGVEQDKWSGQQDWIEVSFPVETGTRTFEWTYSKDSSSSRGDDTAWIDDIAFPVN